MSHISAYFLMRSSSFRMYVEAVAESCWDVFRLAGRCLLSHFALRGVRLTSERCVHVQSEYSAAAALQPASGRGGRRRSAAMMTQR